MRVEINLVNLRKKKIHVGHREQMDNRKKKLKEEQRENKQNKGGEKFRC